MSSSSMSSSSSAASTTSSASTSSSSSPSSPLSSLSSSSASYATRNNSSSSCNRKGGRRNMTITMKMNRSSSSSSLSLLVLRVLVVTTISLFLLCCCFGGGGGGGYQGSNMLFANALSMSSSSSSSSSTSSTTSATTTSATTTTTTATTKNRIEYFDPDIADANNDQLLIAIQECRRTSFPPEKKNFMDAERDFIAAKTVTSKKKLCAIIFDNNDNNDNNNDNNPNPNPRILGTADLQPQYNYINKEKVYIPKGIISNVFVRPDQRGKKFGQQLMIDGIENILIKQLVLKLDDETSVNDASRINGVKVKLTLDVYTQNKPALQLYLKLGYTPDGPVNDGVYKMSQLFNSNLFITLTKTIQV